MIWPYFGFALATAFLELLDDLLLRGHVDKRVADPASELSRLWLHGGDSNLDRLVWQVEDAQVLDGVMRASMGLIAALPEEPDHLDRFLEHREPLVGCRPLRPEHVFVQVLTGTDAEEKASWHQARDRRGRVGDDSRMDADHRARHTGTDPELSRRLSDAAEDRPDESAMPLGVHPRMDVVRDQAEAEAGPLSRTRMADEVRRRVLLG